MESIKCPCCGGQTTNYLNCDYCGSYLVRFNKRNLSYDESQLGKNADVVFSIQEELQANLDEQVKTNARNHICSKTYTGRYNIEIMNPRAVGDFVKYDFGGTIHTIRPHNPFDQDEISLVLVIRIVELDKSFSRSLTDHERMRQLNEKLKLEWLEHTGLMSLCIKCEDKLSSMEGNKGICHSYYLNFGQDTVGASKAISSFLFGVNSIRVHDSAKFIRYSIPEIRYQANIRKLKDEKKNEFKNRLIILMCLYVASIVYFWFRERKKIYIEPFFVGVGLITVLFILYLLYLVYKRYRSR